MSNSPVKFIGTIAKTAGQLGLDTSGVFNSQQTQSPSDNAFMRARLMKRQTIQNALGKRGGGQRGRGALDALFNRGARGERRRQRMLAAGAAPSIAEQDAMPLAANSQATGVLQSSIRRPNPNETPAQNEVGLIPENRLAVRDTGAVFGKTEVAPANNDPYGTSSGYSGVSKRQQEMEAQFDKYKRLYTGGNFNVRQNNLRRGFANAGQFVARANPDGYDRGAYQQNTISFYDRLGRDALSRGGTNLQNLQGAGNTNTNYANLFASNANLL